MKKIIAKVIAPYADKNWSFQLINATEQTVGKIRVAFNHPEVKQAEPFLQGNNGGWVMVEFWTKDLAKIVKACNRLGDLLKVQFTQGEFTRKELELE